MTHFARYFDGTSNRAHPVEVRATENLEIRAENGELIANWAWNNLRRQDGTEQQLRLTTITANEGESLEIVDEALIATIRQLAPDLARRKKTDGGSANHTIFLVIAAAVIFIGLFLYSIPQLASVIAPLVPHTVEKRFGDAVYPHILKALDANPDAVCDARPGQAALAKLVAPILAAANFEQPPIIEVIASDQQNAFALPGGRIILLKGLIESAGDPSQVAGVLAHELGHVHHHHHMALLIEAAGRTYLVAMLFGDFIGSAAIIAGTNAMLGSSFSRKLETEADDYGLEIIGKSGISAKGMADFLELINKGETESSAMRFLSTHPVTSERIAKFRAAMSQLNDKPLLNDQEWGALQGICQ